MAGRNDHAIVDALDSVAQALQGQLNHQGDVDEFRGLDKFQRNRPPIFKGIYELEGAHAWLREIEKISRVMACTEVQKMQFGIHMLLEEAEDWWNNMRQILEAFGSKCIKFESGLHSDFKQGICYQEIRRFHMLVNKCRIYDEDNRDRSTQYKSLYKRKGKNQYHGNPYSAPAHKGK
ncbi:uncharacterized protein LOC127130885 [Lathyrus oleraceus]|uniref:uncharacterized protein LOC127130885 n=1 Tax=Pisum sativum TaxID=3888 RepID=UPI0021D028FC|nr:uncharacterized protein LOC127130885 [Pisum sativum]